MTTVNLPSTLGAEATADSGFLGSVAAWLTTTDHKRIGRLFIGTAALWLLAFVGVASLLGFERIDSKSLTLNEGMMTQLFAASKTLASFGVMVPLMLGLSLALAPTQVGSRSVMFARNAMLGFYLWAIGSAVVVASLIGNGGPGGGNAQMVDLYLLGLALVMLGLLAAAVSVVATVLSARTAGTDLADVPSFAWSSMIGSISLVLTLPVALGTLIYVAVDHHYTRVAFEANMGIMKWLGWSMSQPQTFLYVIPAIGILAELAPAVARRAQPLRGGVFVGVGLISVALLGTVTQTVHGFAWTGTLIDKAKSFVPYALFNLLPILLEPFLKKAYWCTSVTEPCSLPGAQLRFGDQRCGVACCQQQLLQVLVHLVLWQQCSQRFRCTSLVLLISKVTQLKILIIQVQQVCGMQYRQQAMRCLRYV